MPIHQLIAHLIESGQPFAVGLILSAEGSTPREAGVKAVIEPTGRIHGTLGGGAVEAEAQRAAMEACTTGRARVLEVILTGATAAGRDPICGGRMRILLDPTASKDAAAYTAAAEAIQQRSRGVLLTVVRSNGGTRTEVHWRAQDDLQPPLTQLPVTEPSMRESLAAETVTLHQATDPHGGTVEILAEPVVPNPLLVIAGGGHVGQALAAQAVLIGFDVTVVDDRPEFTDPALFPEGVITRCGDIGRELAAQPLGTDTYVVIVTRGHQHDAEALRACIGRPAAYIGMIGSRRKVALMRESFLSQGWATAEQLDGVFAPIGLDIGAETVPETAASIAAQLVQVRRKGIADALARGAMPR